MSNASTYLGAGSAIKSIQSGSLIASSTSHAITISAVDVSQCVLVVERLSRGNYYNGTSYVYGSGKLALTNSTTLTFTQNNAYGSVVSWRVIEYAGTVKSRQFVTVGNGDTAAGTTSISSVVPAKTLVTFNGAQYDHGVPSNAQDTGKFGWGWLASATSIGWAPINQTIQSNTFQVTEFW